MTPRIHLVSIDNQNDFVDPDRGALNVPGALDDSRRVTKLIHRLKDRLSGITFTLDSHFPLHIAHPLFWMDAKGNQPAAFTVIEDEDMRAGRWTTRNPAWAAYAFKYLQALKTGGRYPHRIWPPHCLVGSWGHALEPGFCQAVIDWQVDTVSQAEAVTKGTNPLTEHFSAVKAEVPIDSDPGTKLNTRFLDTLREADEVLITGQALSHCVANTFRDVADEFGNAHIRKLILLTDACSPVAGCEALAETFVKEMTARGMRTSTTADYLA